MMGATYLNGWVLWREAVIETSVQVVLFPMPKWAFKNDGMLRQLWWRPPAKFVNYLLGNGGDLDHHTGCPIVLAITKQIMNEL